jgi:hypothetical protein
MSRFPDAEPDRVLPWRAAALAPWQAGRRPTTLILAAALPVMIALTGFLPRGLDGLALIVGVVTVWVLTLRAAARMLLTEAAGARTRPERDGIDVPPGLAARLVGLWILALLPISAALSETAGGWLSRLVGLVAVAALPLATIVLARSVSFLEALDPINWRETATELGMSRYLRLAGALAGLAACYALLTLVPLPEGLIRVSLQSVFWIWATLAWFGLAGAALHRSGLSPAVESVSGPAPIDPDAEFERLTRQGGTAVDHRRLTDALLMRRDTPRLIEHGRVHVLALLDGFEQPREAVELAATLLEHDAGFTLSDTGEMARLVAASCRHGYPALTVALARNFLAVFPRSFKCDGIRLSACEAAAGGAPEDRRATAEWLNALIAASLDDERRARLKRIVPVYHAEGLIRGISDR